MENKETDAKLLAIVLHDIQSPLRFIKTIMQELVTNFQDLDKELLIEHLKMVNNSVASLHTYCNNINSWKKLTNKPSIKKRATNINTVFTDVKNIYAPLIKFKQLQFNVIETDLNCFVEKEILFIIIINLIDNAFKNTNKGSITLEAFIENNNTLIKVSDTGKGMQQKLIDDILGEKIKLMQSSLGYYIIDDLLKKINAKIAINSIKDAGTSVVISLSNPEKHGSACQGS